MSKTEIYNYISKNRTILMGIAILWVVLHHCNCNTHYDIPKIISFPILNLGYCGVDLFLFLSGFGIYCSLSKNTDELMFIKKRIIRLLPVFPVFILHFLISIIVGIFYGIIWNKTFNVDLYER